MSNSTQNTTPQELTFEEFKLALLNDFRIANESRQASLLGRKEVLTGKAKFGIFGDGKEIAQIAMAKSFKNGDFRSGYYRDQTFMFATGMLSIQEFFAQLYADPSIEAEPCSAGRMMNGHYGTRSLNPDGTWKDLTAMKNSSADISPTGGQMPRLLGLAYASKLYRSFPELANEAKLFTRNGDEVAYGTIGDASTSEGLFWESINAAGVLQIPMVISVWDDGYGISVPAKYQTTKQNISEILSGFERTEEKEGYVILTGKGWDYAGLVELYEKAANIARTEHVPVLVHVREMTQPQGHSTSGSHERYKSKDRLTWEDDFDCIKKMKEWLINAAIATAEELDAIEEESKKTVNQAKQNAWNDFLNAVKSETQQAVHFINEAAAGSPNKIFIERIAQTLAELSTPERKDGIVAIKKAMRYLKGEQSAAKNNLVQFLNQQMLINKDRYNDYLYSQSALSALNVAPVAIEYPAAEQLLDGREVLQANWDVQLSKNKSIVIFGEDVGNIGGVNQTYAGLQAKFGENRLIDTGIREATIIGQGIGLAMRGFRPVAEIQYLDYLAYAIQILSDDLATLQYRTKGGQKAPLIVTTRGHRLEGVWHSGSPMQFILGALRGMHILVPRNMTQAAGFYNTLLKSDEPALVIEPLNGYRIKEKLPNNLGEFCLPLGQVEVMNQGSDITLVTYGSCVRVAQDAINQLSEHGISVELIDVQSLLPFDLDSQIAESIKKTNKVLFLDEDVSGGATSYMLQQVIEGQSAFKYLDMEPRTLTAKDHRPAYGSDGDYFSKPSAEDIFDTVYSMMHQYNPSQYPSIY
jgi:pyruvate/2-oxoglutarate/acetoin dehydrogenase E1 component/TPP-dependent pyruvate/acetoin dehydrogenase alpha subunit